MATEKPQESREGVAEELKGLNRLADTLDDDAARTLRAAVNRLVQRLYPRPDPDATDPPSKSWDESPFGAVEVGYDEP